MFVMVWELFEEYDWIGGILLIPAGLVIGGVGATFFPWVFKRWILVIHYMLWL